MSVEAVFKKPIITGPGPTALINIHTVQFNNNNNTMMDNDSFFNGNNGQSGGYGSVSDNNDSFYNFESFVDPSMLLPDEVNFGALNANDYASIDSIPSLPNAIPPINSNTKGAQPSLYEKLTTSASPMMPSSPALYTSSTSPYTMGSPSSLMMASANEPAWMHSHRPRRRRSTYASPTLMPQALPPHSPMSHSPMMYMAASPAGFMPYHHPQASSLGPIMSPATAAAIYQQTGFMMASPMSPMNVTVKLPMAPLTPTNSNSSSSSSASASSVKVPLVLPCHLQASSEAAYQAVTQNQAAPNVSKLQTNLTSASSLVSSGAPSRCSSIAPGSSVSSRSNGGSSAPANNWFAEMSVTKDRFLQDVSGLDFGNVTVMELKQILRKFGLNSTGKKVQLVERIQEIANYLRIEGRKRVKTTTTTSSSSSGAIDEITTISTTAASCVSAATSTSAAV